MGMQTLVACLQAQGVQVNVIAPGEWLPNITLRRLLFNEQLRLRDWRGYDAVVGFDMDGYRIPRGVPHIAAIKGVIADELRYEGGVTRALLSMQAACERRNVHRADLVITCSEYSAGQIQKLYRVAKRPVVVPEPIDLDRWQIVRSKSDRFTVLSVCRAYPRKRVPLLLKAAELLASRIPDLEIRIVGLGGEAGPVPSNVKILGRLSFDELRGEYGRADMFCMPSIQEGFGIVFLEAMGAGLPIVAARAAAMPEVIPQGLLVDPNSAVALADGIYSLYCDPRERERLCAIGKERVKQYDGRRVAGIFLDAIKSRP